MSEADTLVQAALAVLGSAEPEDKVRLSRNAAAAWRAGQLTLGDPLPVPRRPARPERPVLRRPGDMPKRRAAGGAGRIALLHALAHIELNAVDLAWDLIARFVADRMPRDFADDWVRVADEEALHFSLLSRRLADLGAAYGDLPAHDGLWQAAEDTSHDLLARLAVVPLVLEARGLDVTPAMIAKLRKAGDRESAETLETIYQDEIGHVATGQRWFAFACARRGLEPAAAWGDMVRTHFKGALKPPFNTEGRDAAGLPEAYYRPLAGT